MRDSLAIAIEGLSWMAYEGLGERTAFFRAASELGVTHTDALRQAHRIIMETTRFQNRLEYMISQLPAVRGAQAPHGIRSFLKILAYLSYVQEARKIDLVRQVGLARQVLGWRELHPYENQIALIVSRWKPPRDAALPEFEKLALETCHPAWFVERLTTVFGRNQALKILHRNLQPLASYVRLNSLKTKGDSDEQKVLAELEGVKIEGLKGVLRLMRGRPTNLVDSGKIVTQDLASIAAGLVSSPKPGAVVVDLCAAPGNKTTHLAAQMQNQGEVYSIDISSRRLAHWKKEIARCGCEIAKPVRADARRIPLRAEADLVLVDPPCSNTGVFARNPAGKWRLTAAKVNEFALKQYSILAAGSEQVGDKGILVYCTCSILPEENEYVIEAFLRKNPEFRVAPQTPFLGSQGLRGFDACQRFYPHLHECNGYFIAKLQRTG